MLRFKEARSANKNTRRVLFSLVASSSKLDQDLNTICLHHRLQFNKIEKR